MYKSTLIFDSGVGGFSILQELIKLRPYNHRFIYLADQAYFPYGEKEGNFIQQRIFYLISQLTTHYKIDCIALACNTVTSFSISELRKKINAPIIGVEPVIKPLSKFKRPLLLATKATLKSKHLKDLIKQFSPHNLQLYSPPHLATAIEQMNTTFIESILNQTKEKYPNIDAIGLSCTHYPLVLDLFRKTFPLTTIIEPSQAVAKQILRVCQLKTEKSFLPKIEWLTTGNGSTFSKQIKFYLRKTASLKTINL